MHLLIFYQNDTLQLIQHEEGRIVPKAGGWDYQYHLRDHLGNVRVTFSTHPEVYEMTEDFEGGENGFASLHPHTHLAANTTTDGNKVERLQSGQIGAMTLLSVNKGDTINLTVNANYETTPSGNGWLETAHSVLFNALNTSYGEVIEGGVATSEWSDALHGVQMSPKHETSDAPRAFLNYILFDQNMNYVTAGFEQLSTAAHGVGVHETLSMGGIVAEQEGYVLAYLSNENAEPVNVHFDDFTVTQTKTRVVSSQDYYPFGGTFNSFTRNYSEPQRFKYNGKELEEETGWSDFGARQYDRWSGRWMGMDPLGDLRNWVSPYNFVQNNPINRVDPDGALDREIRSLTTINRVERIDGGGETDFVLNKKTGEISLIKETDDNFDVLYAQNDEGGADENNSIQVEKGVLDNPSKDEVQTKNGSIEITIYDMTGDAQGEVLHEFVATNSNVEWGLTQAGEAGSEGVNILSTSNQKSSEAGSVTAMKKVQSLGIILRRHIHSHPANTPVPSTGDLKFWGKWSNDNSIFQIFTPKDKKYITYPNLLPEVEVNPDKN